MLSDNEVKNLPADEVAATMADLENQAKSNTLSISEYDRQMKRLSDFLPQSTKDAAFALRNVIPKGEAASLPETVSGGIFRGASAITGKAPEEIQAPFMASTMFQMGKARQTPEVSTNQGKISTNYSMKPTVEALKQYLLERKSQQSADRPISSTASEIGGGILGMPASPEAALPRALLGGFEGRQMVKSENPDASLGRQAIGVATGILAGPTADLFKGVLEKAGTAVAGVNPSKIMEYIKRAKFAKNAREIEPITGDVINVLKKTSGELSGESGRAYETLSGKSYTPTEMRKTVAQALADTKGSQELSSFDNAAQQIANDLKFYQQKGGGVAATRIKTAIKNLDTLAKWDAPRQEIGANEIAARNIRQALDAKLKTFDPYSKAMEALAPKSEAFNPLYKRIMGGNVDDFTRQERAQNMLSQMASEKKPIKEAIWNSAETVAPELGALSREARDRKLSDFFNQEITRGSRNVNQFKEYFKSIDPKLEWLGAMTGAVADKYGAPMTKQAIDVATKIKGYYEKNPELVQRVAETLVNQVDLNNMGSFAANMYLLPKFLDQEVNKK